MRLIPDNGDGHIDGVGRDLTPADLVALKMLGIELRPCNFLEHDTLYHVGRSSPPSVTDKEYQRVIGLLP